MDDTIARACGAVASLGAAFDAIIRTRHATAILLDRSAFVSNWTVHWHLLPMQVVCAWCHTHQHISFTSAPPTPPTTYTICPSCRTSMWPIWTNDAPLAREPRPVSPLPRLEAHSTVLCDVWAALYTADSPLDHHNV